VLKSMLYPTRGGTSTPARADATAPTIAPTARQIDEANRPVACNGLE
jgi:hypothetical protein